MGESAKETTISRVGWLFTRVLCNALAVVVVTRLLAGLGVALARSRDWWRSGCAIELPGWAWTLIAVLVGLPAIWFYVAGFRRGLAGPRPRTPAYHRRYKQDVFPQILQGVRWAWTWQTYGHGITELQPFCECCARRLTSIEHTNQLCCQQCGFCTPPIKNPSGLEKAIINEIDLKVRTRAWRRAAKGADHRVDLDMTVEDSRRGFW